jgi:hypothetical protein
VTRGTLTATNYTFTFVNGTMTVVASQGGPVLSACPGVPDLQRTGVDTVRSTAAGTA